MTTQNQGGQQNDAGSGGNTGDDGQQQQDSQQQQSGGQVDDGQGQSGGTGGDDGDSGDDKPTITEAQLKARLARAEESWKRAQQDEQRRAQQTAEQNANERADEAERNATAAVDKAKNALARSAAGTIAQAEGGRNDRIDAIVAHADLSEVEVDDDLNVTKEGRRAIKSAVKAVLKDFPEWATESGAPGEHNSDNTQGTSSLESQIAAAQEKNDWRLVEKLRAKQLREQGKFKLGA